MNSTAPLVKLLLVDDEEANLAALRAILADLGYPLVTARSAQETFRHLLQDEFALLLLDVAMPGLNGLELAALLHEREQTYLTPIIFITAHYNDAESIAKSYRAGGVDYLIKPVNPDVLRAKVQVFAQLAQARQQLKTEVAERRRAEEELQRLNDVLEERVAQRTGHLTQANEALIREIAERKWAEAELHKAKEALAQTNANLEKLVQERTAKLHEAVGELEHFSYTITHDMRAPLRAIQGFAGLMEEQCSACLDGERKQLLQRITTSAGRMDRLITDALSYSKTMQQQLTVAPVDVAALLRGIIESYPGFQPPKAQIQVEGRLPKVLANEAGLTQCFSNLLGNAVKFVKPGQTPHVRIRAEKRVVSERVSESVSGKTGEGNAPSLTRSFTDSLTGSSVRIWIEDNGIGIPDEFKPRLFGMFQRASKTHEGTGIGLALVKKVMERMGGQVGVESEPGKGSRFWVELRGAEI